MKVELLLYISNIAGIRMIDEGIDGLYRDNNLRKIFMVLNPW